MGTHSCHSCQPAVSHHVSSRRPWPCCEVPPWPPQRWPCRPARLRLFGPESWPGPGKTASATGPWCASTKITPPKKKVREKCSENLRDVEKHWKWYRQRKPCSRVPCGPTKSVLKMFWLCAFKKKASYYIKYFQYYCILLVWYKEI